MKDCPKGEDAKEICQKVAEIFIKTGLLIVRDPRVQSEDNERFLDMMEDYFNQEHEIKMNDSRPQYGYQVGVTPDNTEVPRCIADPNCQNIIEKLAPESRPQPLIGADAKWRFFWRIGPRPQQTKFKELNAEKVIPKAFPQWESVMDKWGILMMTVATTVAEMTAVGLGLPEKQFSDMTINGPHLLAPTGSDLTKSSKKGDILAGFHYDLNFLTIHGKSRYSGLNAWTRNGEKISVRVPDGCLLLQAGKQIEWLTGGHIHAGYHEVVVNENTLQALEKAKEKNRPLWRISSTLFLHIASDQTLQPLSPFSNPQSLEKYPPTLAGDYVSAELGVIKLMS